MGRPKVVIDLHDANCARDLSAGGMFVGSAAIAAAGCTLTFNDEIDLVVRGGTEELTLHARVVFVDPAKGAGLELVGFSPAMKEQIAQLDELSQPDAMSRPAVDAEPEIELEPLTRSAAESASDADFRSGSARDPDPVSDLDPDPVPDPDPDPDSDSDSDSDSDPDSDPDSDSDSGSDSDPAAAHNAAAATAPDADADADADAATAADADADADAATAADADADDGDTSEEGNSRKKLALSMHERLRGLTIVDQLKKASSRDPNERMTLERIYGKTVWEALLRNPRLTPPEVARLARMGSMPRPLIEIIVNNGSWIQVPEVRRALLGNPRLGVDQILRVLRLLPKHELKVAASLMTYPHAVRDAAKRMLREP